MSHVDDGSLNALLDGELDAEEVRRVEAHLGSCEVCRARFEEARSFLAEAGELIGLLGPGPVTVVPEEPAAPRRVAATAKEKGLDLDAGTGKSPAVRPIFPQGERRVAATRKERAIDAATAKSPAVDPGGGRELPDVATGGGAQPAWRRAGGFTMERLAWAASVALALGVGYLANEVRLANNRLERAQQLGLAADTSGGAAQSEATGAAASVPGELREGRPPASQRSGRAVATKPPAMRGTKPPTPAAAADAALRGAAVPPPAARRDAAGTGGVPGALGAEGTGRTGDRAADQPAAPRQRTPAGGAAPAGVQQARPDAAGGAAAQPPQAPLAGAAPAPAPTQRRPGPPAGAAGANALEEADLTPAAFRRVSMEEANFRLSGSIRVIDGMDPVRYEVGPGRLIPGADPERDVVRVVYTDPRGRRLTLDQQPGNVRGEESPTSVNGMMRGDTLVTGTTDGGVRVRWVDRKFFWLSLTGTLQLDSMRALVDRIR
jgi:hypothetical protein